MRFSGRSGAVLVILIAVLGACGEQARDTAPPTSRGRYAGIGTYPAGTLWSRMEVAAQPKDAASARIEDDDQIIVVVDSVTGEVRQCGDLSGYCIGMNPWTGALGSAAPVSLTVHAADLARETEPGADADPVVNTKAATPDPKG
jgi:hypothetical protein